MNGSKFGKSINGLLVLFLFLVFIIPVVTIFFFDLRFYYIPENEIGKFYIYSLIYSTLGVLAAIIITIMFRKEERSKIPNTIRLVLGILWIVDGILQFQPEMPYGFLSVVIEPSIQAINNVGVERFLMIAYNIWLLHPFQFDALSGSLQIFIGAAYLLNRSTRALKYISFISIIWALVIWIFGEGLGGIPESGVSLLTGFPGSALIYIIIAVPYISPKLGNIKNLQRYFIYTVSAIFLIGGILQLIPGNTFWTKGQLAYDIYMNINQQGENPIVYAILNHSYVYLLFRENYINIFMFLLMIASGLFILLHIRTGLVLATVFVGLTWLLFQDMGIYILPATDPNTGLPLLLVLLILIEIDFQVSNKRIIKGAAQGVPIT
ncbi:hypothetical protein [Cuniculiplasma divulgatum]|uniref:Multipass membrane protein n=1 Tax=Cuniculiplasma divulgatum TaxID=1673428 RepID=A0A1R4A8C7_9ARCH|nr:hypothetical protein [Cuniculiplasma divulgatum]SJK85234.1 multipass membrane protein [Cuniculiplasma divulgatum]